MGRKNEKTDKPGSSTKRDRTGAQWLPGRIVELRAARGLTEAEAAEAARMSQSEWHRFEHGLRGPNLRRLRGISQALKTPIRLLFVRPGVG